MTTTFPETPTRPAPVPATPKRAFRLKRILVPTDFSGFANKALDYAQAFAERNGAEIVLLHVVEPTYYAELDQTIPPNFFELQRDLVRSRHEHLDRIAKEKVTGRVPARAVVHLGNPYSVIVETAKAMAVDLIIIATHGHTGLKHALLGSTAERVVRHAPCPVLTVRDREHDFVEYAAA